VSRFDDKVALVTGGSSGLGRAVALSLAGEGAAVALLARGGDALERVAAECERAGARTLVLPADVTNAAAVEAAVARTVTELGGVDQLVHAAGALRLGPLPALTEEDWDVLFSVNVKSCYLLARHVIPAMRARGGGAIVHVSSAYALACDPGGAAYGAAKAAVIALTRGMALDHAAEGIRVNAVVPGGMRTPMLEAVARERGADPEQLFAAAGARNPLGRMVAPDEVVALVLHLLGDEASALAGGAYAVDGGLLARLG